MRPPDREGISVSVGTIRIFPSYQHSEGRAVQCVRQSLRRTTLGDRQAVLSSDLKGVSDPKGEPAPVEFTVFARRAGEVIAKAARAMRKSPRRK